jgi:hypothetical protein
MSNVPLLLVTEYPAEVGPPRSVSVQLMPAVAGVAQSANTASENVAPAARHQADRDLWMLMPGLPSGHGVSCNESMGFMMILIR